MNCSLRPQGPISEDTLPELQYETYLERYHNISHEITAIRTKTAIMMGIIGVIFTIIFSFYANLSKSLDYETTIIWVFGGIFLLIFLDYFLLYVQVHTVDLTVYPDMQTLKDIKSDDTNVSHRSSRRTLLKEINIHLEYISDDLNRKYKFYKGTSGVVDFMFLVLFGVGGIALINLFLGSSINQDLYFLFVLSSLLLLAGCGIITLILFVGMWQKIMKWFVEGSRLKVIGVCIFFTLVVWVVLLGSIFC